MSVSINYVQQFKQKLEQKYALELRSGDLGENGAKFIGTKTIKIPRLVIAGYKEHSRSGGWNRQAVGNDWETKTLAHDRDIEMFVDVMDVDETNQVLSAANLTNTFEEEQAIPELDAYRFSKIFYDYTETFNKTPNTTVLSVSNILGIFDQFMEDMDDAGVPQEGRILYCIPAVHTLLKTAQGITRNLDVQSSNRGINRAVRSLDDVRIVQVPSARMMTLYDFSDGFEPDKDAVQINMILVHPRSVIAVQKHSAIYLHQPGAHTVGDGYLYQNRRYGDLFLIENKIDGVKINVEAAADDTPAPVEVTFTAAQDGGTSATTDSTGIVLTFNKDVVGLQASHITLTNGTGEAVKGALTGSAKVWTLAITPSVEGDVTVKVSGLDGYSFPSTATTVAIYKQS